MYRKFGIFIEIVLYIENAQHQNTKIRNLCKTLIFFTKLIESILDDLLIYSHANIFEAKKMYSEEKKEITFNKIDLV